MVAVGSVRCKESKASIASLRYNRPVREYELILRLLADRVLTSRLASGARILDASDFKAWLLECADIAAACDTVEQFFESIR
jgi:hypothetical protein